MAQTENTYNNTSNNNQIRDGAPTLQITHNTMAESGAPALQITHNTMALLHYQHTGHYQLPTVVTNTILYNLYTMEPLLYQLWYILHDGAPLIALQTRHLILSWTTCNLSHPVTWISKEESENWSQYIIKRPLKKDKLFRMITQIQLVQCFYYPASQNKILIHTRKVTHENRAFYS